MWKAKILIVEDSQSVSQLLADAFRFDDFEVLQAYTAVDGLRLAGEEVPDVILMDIQLPDVDGLTAAQALKNDQVTKHIPIVAMTAHDIIGDQARLMSRICVGYIQKPILTRDLLNLISAVLRLPGDQGPPTRRHRPA